jgi:hypothetical protein
MHPRLTARLLLITVLETLGVALLVFVLAWGLVGLAGRMDTGRHTAPVAAPTASPGR